MRGIRRLPSRIEIELTNCCNLKCKYCPRNRIEGFETGFMSFALFRKIIDEMSPHKETVLQLHRRGESLLHPEFKEMLYYVKDKFTEVQLATNAVLLDTEKSTYLSRILSFISFSLDHPLDYAKNKGTDCYQLVESNILNFLKINNGRVRTQVSMVKTESQATDKINWFVSVWKNKVDRIRIYEEHSKNGKFGSLDKKRKNRHPCVKPFTNMVVYWNGDVARCNHDWNGAPMGNLEHETILEIYNNEKYRKLRKAQQTLSFTEAPCRDCDSWYAEEGVQGTGMVYQLVSQ